MAAKRGEFGTQWPYARQERKDFYAIPLTPNSFASAPTQGIVTRASNKVDLTPPRNVTVIIGDF